MYRLTFFLLGPGSTGAAGEGDTRLTVGYGMNTLSMAFCCSELSQKTLFGKTLKLAYGLTEWHCVLREKYYHIKWKFLSNYYTRHNIS